MRTILFVLLCLPLAAQEAIPEPETPTAVKNTTKYEFTCTQGWTMLTTVGSDEVLMPSRYYGVTLAPELLMAAKEPRLNGPGLTTANVSEEEWKKWRLDHATHRMVEAPRISHDPITLMGTVSLEQDGTPTFTFKALHYWDESHSWSIRFQRTYVGVATHGGGGWDWQGSYGDWPDRLQKLKRACMEAVLKVSAPQITRKEAETKAAGAEFQKEIARRVFLFHALEEQYVMLHLAGLNGLALTEARWKEMEKNSSERVVSLARQILGRITTQCRGELAPEGKSVIQEAKWDEETTALPQFAWTTYTLDDYDKEVDEAKQRMADLADQSLASPKGITRRTWEEALLKEVRRLNRLIRPYGSDEGNTEPAHLRLPWVAVPGSGTFTYKGKKKMRKGAVHSSKALSSGVASGITLFFFDTSLSRYVGVEIKLKSWYRGEVEAQ